MAVVAAAGVLVLGMDFATFAATGDSLILGQLNRADMTTSLTNTGRGPALRLNSGDAGSPALEVNSDARVRHLNADELDGRTAKQLTSHAVTFQAGSRGLVVHGAGIWNLPVPVGAYQVTFKAVVIPSTGDPLSPTQVVCGVADLLTFGQNTRIYTADLAMYMGDFPAIMSGAEAVQIRPGQQPGLVCTTAASTLGTDFTLFTPVTASFTRINSRQVRQADPVSTPTGASAERLGLWPR